MSERSGGSRRALPIKRPARLQGARWDWRRAWAPVLCVVIVVGAAVFVSMRDATKSTVRGAADMTLSRTLACVPDAANSSTRVGTVPAATKPVMITNGRAKFAPAEASSGYGVQWLPGRSGGTAWLAARSCPTVGDDWWFVGVGPSTQHSSVLTLDNPYDVDATATITAYGLEGPINIPGASLFSVPAGSHQSWKLADFAADPANPTADITIHVTVTRGLVAASVWETWAQSITSPTVQQWVPVAPAAAKRIQLMTHPGALGEGSTLYVTNPGVSPTSVKMTGINAETSFAPVKHATFSVAAGSTSAVPIGDLGNVAFSSLVLSADQPITAGLRQVQGGGLEEYAVRAVPIGAQSTVGLPSGMGAALSLVAGTAADVAVLAIDAGGQTVLKKTVSIPAQRAMSLVLPAEAVAVRLNTLAAGEVSAAVALTGPGVAVLALVPTANVAVVPPVVPLPF